MNERATRDGLDQAAEFEESEAAEAPDVLPDGEPEDVDAVVIDDPVTDDGDALPDEVRAELEALAAADLEHGTEVEQALASAQRELAHQRAATHAALERYREAVLAAEPDLPPDLVRGETLEELEGAIASAREVVARVREQVQASALPSSFPVGAPAREGVRRAGGMTAAEKIAAGLEGRER
jgi:hypothetical protein